MRLRRLLRKTIAFATISSLMLAPMTPHLAEELWEMLGHSGGLWTVGWPKFNEELARADEVEIVVQVAHVSRSLSPPFL